MDGRASSAAFDTRGGAREIIARVCLPHSTALNSADGVAKDDTLRTPRRARAPALPFCIRVNIRGPLVLARARAGHQSARIQDRVQDFDAAARVAPLRGSGGRYWRAER